MKIFKTFKILKNIIFGADKDVATSKWEQYKENLTKAELELVKQGSINLFIMLETEEFDSIETYDWVQFLDALIENIQDVIYVLYLQALKDRKKDKGYILSLYPIYVQSKILFFICDNARLGNIQHYDNIEGRDELQKRYEDYTNLILYHNDKRVSDMREEQDFSVITCDLLVAYDNVKCPVNPREVVEFLYSSPIGIKYLPKELIQYLKKEADTKANTSEAETMILNQEDVKSSEEKKSNNQSGSKINPESHAKTRQACIKAREKVQKEKIFELNQRVFCDITNSFLGQGESLNTTVARAFYKDEVSKDYKAGVGRKSK